MGSPHRVESDTDAFANNSKFGSTQDLTSGATITLPPNRCKLVSASGGSVTGIIMTKGKADGQKLTICNLDASGTVTFATAATSFVADGAGTAISALRAVEMTWVESATRWFKTG